MTDQQLYHGDNDRLHLEHDAMKHFLDRCQAEQISRMQEIHMVAVEIKSLPSFHPRQIHQD